MTNNKIFFKNLDSIRFIAALMVFLQHGISPSYKYLPIENTILEKILNIISSGGTGVSIFFVLSGFLITYLLISEYELNTKISLRNFYIRRILRIWPLYFSVVIFSFYFYPFLKNLIGYNTQLGSNVLYQLFFLSNFDVININKYCAGCDAMSQNITWSVSIEEQFYLFWPLIFVFISRKFWGYAILFVIIISISFRIINIKDSIVLYFHTLSVLLDLGIGGLIAFLIKSNFRIRNFFQNTSSITHIILFLTSFCLIFFYDKIFDFKLGLALNRIFISFSFALIIAAQSITKNESKFNLANLTFASKWGKYTYGIYLLHPIPITLTDVALRLLHVPTDNFTTLISIGILNFILTLIISRISYKYFESKFLLLKDRFSYTKLD